MKNVPSPHIVHWSQGSFQIDILTHVKENPDKTLKLIGTSMRVVDGRIRVIKQTAPRAVEKGWREWLALDDHDGKVATAICLWESPRLTPLSTWETD